MSSYQSMPVLPHLSHSSPCRPATSRTHAAMQHRDKLAASHSQADINTINIYVKSPFKHQQNSTLSSSLPTSTSPDRQLIQQTAQATYNISQSAFITNSPSAGTLHDRKQGKLRRARLVPMNPVIIEGPEITQCRGILAGTRPQSTSRTLARQKLIITMLTNDMRSSRRYSEPTAANQQAVQNTRGQPECSRQVASRQHQTKCSEQVAATRLDKQEQLLDTTDN